MKALLLSILLICCIHLSSAQIDDLRLYTFGHSLIDHRPPAIPTPNDETTILYWINDIAQHVNNSFATGGQYGFLTSHDDLPPSANWGYDGITPVWDGENQTFSEADINTILITAANFIQDIPSNGPHPLDESTTAVESTETIFDWVDQEESNVRFFIYLNWPEIGWANAYPPQQSEIDYFHELTVGSFADWWIDYQDYLLASRPQYNTRMIPVGPIISKIHTDLLANQIPFTELYEDNDPHGRATTYFLAGMISYMAMYGQNVPDTYVPSNLVHQDVLDNLISIRDFMWNELLDFNLPNGDSRVFYGTATNLGSVDASLGVELFPNPHLGKFSISGLLSPSSVEIFDAFGKRYQSVSATQGDNVDIDMEEAPAGVYFIQVLDKDNKVIGLKRVIKMD